MTKHYFDKIMNRAMIRAINAPLYSGDCYSCNAIHSHHNDKYDCKEVRIREQYRYFYRRRKGAWFNEIDSEELRARRLIMLALFREVGPLE